ncbi:MAG TPA: preprotein translocase subunit SecG [Pyrinomonadaceae bacterium]|nr:preprotein translocase subunit SecG [Pyrinomonadaceae bacterium]
MIQTILLIIFFMACVVLIASVLLQPGKSDAGALFTSNVSSTAFGPRGTASILSRITIGAAITFMVSALMLAMPALSGNTSLLQSTGIETTTSPTPAPDANTNAPAANTGDANTAVPVSNSNSAVITNTAPADAIEGVNPAPPANK